MKKGKILTLLGVSMMSTVAFAGWTGKDGTLHVQNSFRVGYDDNYYMSTDNEEGTPFVTDILNISGELNFSSRTDLLLYWQPEFRYFMDNNIDSQAVSYQDVYARLSHLVSQRLSVQVSDHFRYQQKDGRSDLGRTGNQNYFQNTLQGAMDVAVSELGSLKVSGGYDLRRWDDRDYGDDNDYDHYDADLSFFHEIRPDTTKGLVGAAYADHVYRDSDRGDWYSVTAFGGVDHIFTPNVTGILRLGGTYSRVDLKNDDNTSVSPYLKAGLDYAPTQRTSFNLAAGYSFQQSDNSIYNGEEGFNVAIGLRHDLTAKISLATSLTYIYSMFDGDYFRDDLGSGFKIDDTKENYFKYSLRGSYQINRNNFLDAGYEYTYRNSDTTYLTDYNRNRFDIGWRLRL